ARWAAELAAQARLAGAGARQTKGAAALTPRELQVLELVAEGLTNPQIGQRLFISRKTASVHVSAILAKIGAANRAEAAALYAASAAASASA
ncbi:helix-turn-helix transcriptional regulator, partial [Microbacterium sp. CCNWLW44]